MTPPKPSYRALKKAWDTMVAADRILLGLDKTDDIEYLRKTRDALAEFYEGGGMIGHGAFVIDAIEAKIKRIQDVNNETNSRS